VIFAEVEVVHTSVTLLNSEDFPGDAACFAHMILGIVDGNALGPHETGEQHGESQCDDGLRHGMISRRRVER
jgi:hypothetical protein